KALPVYGDGNYTRDWLYVIDHAIAIDLVFHKGFNHETYNIGGKNERNNLYIAHTICEILDEISPKSTSYKEQITFVTDRPGHDFRYAIDASKIEKELRWTANENFETGIKKTIEWYLKKYKNL
ncbi:MAG: GDP-mannose 4,6-dehydratase, partial [Polaribacter sp.]